MVQSCRYPEASWRCAIARSLAISFAALAGLLLGPRGVQASAWNEPQGKGLIITDWTFSGGDRYFDGEGRLAPARHYAKNEIASYVEYGATDWLTLVARPSFDMTRIGAPDAGHYGAVGGTTIGGQVPLYDYGPAVFAVQGSFRMPGTVSPHNPAAVGDTAREGDFRLLGGISFPIGPYPAFIDGQGSYRLRSGGAAPQWHGDLTFGIKPVPRLLLLLQSFTTVPTGLGNAQFPSSRSSQLWAKAVYELSDVWALQFGLYATLYGRNALRERGVTTGVWYRF